MTRCARARRFIIRSTLAGLASLENSLILYLEKRAVYQSPGAIYSELCPAAQRSRRSRRRDGHADIALSPLHFPRRKSARPTSSSSRCSRTCTMTNDCPRSNLSLLPPLLPFLLLPSLLNISIVLLNGRRGEGGAESGAPPASSPRPPLAYEHLTFFEVRPPAKKAAPRDAA